MCVYTGVRARRAGTNTHTHMGTCAPLHGGGGLVKHLPGPDRPASVLTGATACTSCSTAAGNYCPPGSILDRVIASGCDVQAFVSCAGVGRSTYNSAFGGGAHGCCTTVEIDEGLACGACCRGYDDLYFCGIGGPACFRIDPAVSYRCLVEHGCPSSCRAGTYLSAGASRCVCLSVHARIHVPEGGIGMVLHAVRACVLQRRR